MYTLFYFLSTCIHLCLVMWRVWEDLCGPQDEAPQTTDQDPEPVFEFTFMSYNILAQDLLEGNPELYIHCSEKVLVWSTRLKGIIVEIQTWRPDVSRMLYRVSLLLPFAIYCSALQCFAVVYENGSCLRKW